VIKPHSNRMCSWICPLGTADDPHIWTSRVADRTRHASCPYCGGARTSKANSLAVLAPEIARSWDYDKNQRTPAEYTAKSGYRAHWKCPDCAHEWQGHVHTRVRAQLGCPKCQRRKKNKRHPTFAECSHPMLLQWDHDANSRRGIFPENTRLRSGKQVSWVCSQCRMGLLHKWISEPGQRVRFMVVHAALGTLCANAIPCRHCRR